MENTNKIENFEEESRFNYSLVYFLALFKFFTG